MYSIIVYEYHLDAHPGIIRLTHLLLLGCPALLTESLYVGSL